MDDHNSRADTIWRLIEPTVFWKDKFCVDIGCGHGDFLWRMKNAGALYVLGVDNDPQALKSARDRVVKNGATGIRFAGQWIEEWMPACRDDVYDIVICFSVLPYLSWTYGKALRELRRVVKETLFFEVQYENDGPGKEITSDYGMKALLTKSGWKPKPLGVTMAKGEFKRTIWKCT